MLVHRLRGSRRSGQSKCDDTRRRAHPTLRASWLHQYHANTVPGVLRDIVHKSCMYILPTGDSQLATSRCVSAPSLVGRKTARQSAAVNVAAVKLAAETGAPRKKRRRYDDPHWTQVLFTQREAPGPQTVQRRLLRLGTDGKKGPHVKQQWHLALMNPELHEKKSMSFGRHSGEAYSKTERSE